jgi:hypothetical protein
MALVRRTTGKVEGLGTVLDDGCELLPCRRNHGIAQLSDAGISRPDN